MRNTKDENTRIKEEIKTAWEEGDVGRLIAAGIDSFLSLTIGNCPISFHHFLEYTGDSFDKFIREVSQKEHITYVGGKMILKVDADREVQQVPVQLSADFYFKTEDGTWVTQQKTGMVESSRFSDWESSPDATELRKKGRLELSIEPPEMGAK